MGLLYLPGFPASSQGKYRTILELGYSKPEIPITLIFNLYWLSTPGIALISSTEPVTPAICVLSAVKTPATFQPEV